MTVTVTPSVSPRRTLTVCGGAHALHDGFTDLLNVLYPLLQAQFGLSYAAIGALKTVYSGAMAVGQIPSGKLAVRFGGVKVLAIGTALIAVGYGLAGLTGSIYGVVIGLLLAGLGGSTQHPIGSGLVSAAYSGLRSRTALGTYNFTGDVGKVLLPAFFALIVASLGWQQALIVIAAIAVVGAGIILGTLKPVPLHNKGDEAKATGGQDRPWAYWLLFSIHIADDLVRTGFLIFLPFLLRDKGADIPTIGLGLSLLFAGGAAGKLVMGWVGEKLGVVASVILTEVATTMLILLLLPLSLPLALVLLPARRPDAERHVVSALWHGARVRQSREAHARTHSRSSIPAARWRARQGRWSRDSSATPWACRSRSASCPASRSPPCPWCGR